MKTSESKNTVTTKRGSIIEITATSTRGYDVVEEVSYCDGDNVTVIRGKETKINSLVIVINGQLTLNGYITTVAPANAPESYGYFISNNNKLIPIDQDVYDVMHNCKIAAAVAAETDTSWSEMRTRQIEQNQIDIEYENHVKGVENMMTLNGKTY